MQGLRVIRSFQEKGFELLGNGYYAAVFASKENPNLVYKIGCSVSDPFIDYITRFPHLKNNPHFPIIHNLNISYEDNWYIAQMEELSPLPEHQYSVGRSISSFATYGKETPHLPKDKSLKSILSELSRYVDTREDICMDLHNANLMRRGTTIVINDPFCHENMVNEDIQLAYWLGKEGPNGTFYDTLNHDYSNA